MFNCTGQDCLTHVRRGVPKSPLRSVQLHQPQPGRICPAERASNASTAGECSATVAALVALVTPLPYSADFRPYFTIHDPAFARMAGGQLPCGANRLPRLLGITNLYILKVCLAPERSWNAVHGRIHYAYIECYAQLSRM